MSDKKMMKVKLVRSVGTRRMNRITHLGIEDWDTAGIGDDVSRAATALRRLLQRLGLRKGQLGRIAVGHHHGMDLPPPCLQAPQEHQGVASVVPRTDEPDHGAFGEEAL